MRVLVTAGGTGGHIYPLVSVISELQIAAERDQIPLRIRYIGSTNEKYRKILIEQGVEVNRILGSKLRRYFSFANFVDIPKFLLSLLQALWGLFWFMPDVVFSKGGPGSISIVLAARFYRIPIVIHESDSTPSLTGKITGHHAKVIAVSFESALKYFEKFNGKVVLTGNPIRKSLFIKNVQQNEAKSILGFSLDTPLILVLGGSQGAQRINDFILSNLAEFLSNFQIYHQTGELNYSGTTEAIKKLPNELQDRYKAVSYFEDNLGTALCGADIVVSRAGAGSIYEAAAFGKPSVLIPLLGSAGDHQSSNALEYSNMGAAIVIKETDLSPNLFVNTLTKLFSDPVELISMSKSAKAFYKPDSALQLARIILSIKE